MLNSVQHYVRDVVQGIPTPLTDPVQAFLTPPQLADAAGGPLAYVWGGRLQVNRQTTPRPFGQQKFMWIVTVSITEAFDQDDPTIDSAFPLVVDQVMATFQTTALQTKGVWLTDPVTGNVTQLLAVGEVFQMEHTAVFTTGGPGEGLWLYAADISLTVEELVSFNPGSYYNELFRLGDVPAVAAPAKRA
jgi:hypothetical protein